MAISLREGPTPAGSAPSAGARAVASPAGVGALRERFWNLPNTITVLRTGAVPVLLLLPILGHSRIASHAIAWAFIVAATTDLLDGWLARRGKQVTHVGKLLDPLADKLLVSTALIVLLVSPYPRVPRAEGLEVARIPGWATWMVV